MEGSKFHFGVISSLFVTKCNGEIHESGFFVRALKGTKYVPVLKTFTSLRQPYMYALVRTYAYSDYIFTPLYMHIPQ